MKLRTQFMLFVILAASGALILWLLPQPIIHISSAGSTTTNRYWWWLTLAYLIACGCGVEYFWMEGSDYIFKRMSRRQKITAGLILVLILLVAASYNWVAYYYR